MKIITYLCFTLLSILIQFCVMDFINERRQVEEKLLDVNATRNKKQFNDMVKDLNSKPHALYYRKVNKMLGRSISPSSVSYSNASITEVLMETSTELSSTVFDILYDENITVTESSFTTEPLYTSTDFDNVTEITLFERKNPSKMKPNIKPKKNIYKKCSCNLMYKVCDINCCCDNDCSDMDKLFTEDCTDGYSNKKNNHYCLPYFNYGSTKSQLSTVEELFCIVKINLPQKQNINYKHDPSVFNQPFKWHEISQFKTSYKYSRNLYEFGDPVWVLEEGSVSYLDLPIPTVNNYCSGRKLINFMKDEKVECYVKLKDLEMFQILKKTEEVTVVSATEHSMNNSALNCSSLYCANWTTLVCDGIKYTNYTKNLHEALCTDRVCTNLAVKIDYIFYLFEKKIINITVILYTENVSTNVQLINQEINVKFILSNESADKIIEFSGNPGYIVGLPVIVSTADGNHTEHFFNNTMTRKNHIFYPDSHKGVCKKSNNIKRAVLFGENTRVKCRFTYSFNVFQNATNACKNIQYHINEMLGISKKMVISPYGNPQHIEDQDWIIMIKYNLSDKESIYGKFIKGNSVLSCYNLITRISFMFTFADTSDVETRRENKIVSARLDASFLNATFDVDDISTVLTIDSNFLDENKPHVYEFAGGPYLNIYLPKDFFFPFPSNGSNQGSSVFVILSLFIVLFKK